MGEAPHLKGGLEGDSVKGDSVKPHSLGNFCSYI